jgi:hypothetical protein
LFCQTPQKNPTSIQTATDPSDVSHPNQDSKGDNDGKDKDDDENQDVKDGDDDDIKDEAEEPAVTSGG